MRYVDCDAGAAGPDEDDDCTAVASRSKIVAALAARPQRRPCLILASGAPLLGKMFRIERELTVGRAPDAGIRIDQTGVSRRHAQFVVTPEGGCDVIDLESKNGVFVNGERVTRRTLNEADKIQIGMAAVLKFSYQDALDEALQQNLYDSATRDALTGLANKGTFADVMSKDLPFARRHKAPLALLAFDLDHFKRINDTFGHPAGDAVLKAIAETVTACLREGDVFARVGGEEFAIVLRDASEVKALALAERVRFAVEAMVVRHEGRAIPVTLSMGVAALSRETTVEELVLLADQRLYKAKESGRNRVVGSGPATPIARIVSTIPRRPSFRGLSGAPGPIAMPSSPPS